MTSQWSANIKNVCTRLETMALASKVQALALRDEALRFWPWLHHWTEYVEVKWAAEEEIFEIISLFLFQTLTYVQAPLELTSVPVDLHVRPVYIGWSSPSCATSWCHRLSPVFRTQSLVAYRSFMNGLDLLHVAGKCFCMQHYFYFYWPRAGSGSCGFLLE